MEGELWSSGGVGSGGAMSMGFFVPDDQAVIWRGPMLHKALEQFLVDVDWAARSSSSSTCRRARATSRCPSPSSCPAPSCSWSPRPNRPPSGSRRGQAYSARQLRLPIRGVVENMSWFIGDDGQRYELSARVAADSWLTSWRSPACRDPARPGAARGGDTGRPIVESDPGGDVAVRFQALARRIVELGPARVYRSELSVR